MYTKIANGRYYEPDYLSPLSKDLLKSLLQVDPEKRITISKLIVHPWINKKYTQTLKWKSIYDKNIVDEEVVRELASHFGRPFSDMEARVKEWKFDYLTATYRLLLQQKKRGMNFVLPILKPRNGMANPKQIILGSQTIHASLDNDLNNSGLDENDLMIQETDEATSHGARKSFEGSNLISSVATQQDKVFFFFFHHYIISR
ncbi:unnamed protein product [Brugia timori]|uniref:Maternal embryonic leucine zipper kinase UBA domain-containing protein n=1 Tax=Brugia timori TaxID=42155 RepID=A0A3P7TDI4_9BILA|nr:unnamed protein product [Brugia timori]